MPQKCELDAIEIGDTVKIVFAGTGRDAAHIERMWVEVCEIKGHDMIGILANEPFDLSSVYLKDLVPFRRSDVIDVLEYRFEDKRSICDEICNMGCIVDDAILEGRSPIDYLYREEPEENEEQRFQDSGWRFRADKNLMHPDEFDDENASYTIVGRVLNLDDSCMGLLKKPVGSQFERDPKDGKFIVADD